MYRSKEIDSIFIEIVNCQSRSNSLWIGKKFFLFENEKREDASDTSKRKNSVDSIIIASSQKPLKALSIKKVLFVSPIEAQQMKVWFIKKQILFSKNMKTVKCDKFSKLFSVKTSIFARFFYVIKHNYLLCYLEGSINKGLYRFCVRILTTNLH